MIGNEVTLTILGVKGNQVRFGIEAPKNIRVDREEVRERIKREADGSLQPRYKPDDDSDGNK